MYVELVLILALGDLFVAFLQNLRAIDAQCLSCELELR